MGGRGEEAIDMVSERRMRRKRSVIMRVKPERGNPREEGGSKEEEGRGEEEEEGRGERGEDRRETNEQERPISKKETKRKNKLALSL